LTSARTATRTFDLQLAMAALGGLAHAMAAIDRYMTAREPKARQRPS
jgi:hypothetical protein